MCFIYVLELGLIWGKGEGLVGEGGGGRGGEMGGRGKVFFFFSLISLSIRLISLSKGSFLGGGARSFTWPRLDYIWGANQHSEKFFGVFFITYIHRKLYKKPRLQFFFFFCGGEGGNGELENRGMRLNLRTKIRNTLYMFVGGDPSFCFLHIHVLLLILLFKTQFT